GSGRLAAGRRNRLQRRLRAVVERAVRQWVWGATRAEGLVAERLDDVAAGRESPSGVAAEILPARKSGGAGLTASRSGPSTPAPKAKSASAASRSPRSRTWKICSAGSRSTGSPPP